MSARDCDPSNLVNFWWLKSQPLIFCWVVSYKLYSSVEFTDSIRYLRYFGTNICKVEQRKNKFQEKGQFLVTKQPGQPIQGTVLGFETESILCQNYDFNKHGFPM